MLQNRRLIAAAGAACLAILALAVIVVESADPPPKEYEPSGLSAADASKLTGEKRELWEQSKREYDEAFAKGLPTPSNPGHVLKPTQPEPFPSEIFDKAQPFMGNAWQNGWRGVVGNKNVVVFAGASVDEPKDGRVLVLRSELDGTGTRGETQVIPGSGPLRVAKADGLRLLLVSDSGETYEFDVESEQLLSSSGCCSLQLDFDPAEPGIQASAAVATGAVTYIDVVLGETVANLTALQFKIVYDDTILAPIPGSGGTINGNPDFNDATLGTAWSCSLPAGSGTPDSDPATGPGHGVATLSCFTTSTPASFSTATVLGTLRLTAVAPGETSIEVTGLVSDFDGIQLGSCDPPVEVEMTCEGGTSIVISQQ